MRIIAFTTFSADIQKNLEHIGVEPEAPSITPARGPRRCGMSVVRWRRGTVWVRVLEALPD